MWIVQEIQVVQEVLGAQAALEPRQNLILRREHNFTVMISNTQKCCKSDKLIYSKSFTSWCSWDPWGTWNATVPCEAQSVSRLEIFFFDDHTIRKIWIDMLPLGPCWPCGPGGPGGPGGPWTPLNSETMKYHMHSFRTKWNHINIHNSATLITML